jgi:RNA polymerase sigma factor for flagellar operon FliA
VKEIEAAIQAAEQKLGRAPTEEEIAAELGMSVLDYQDSLTELQAISLASLDAPADGRSGSQLASYVADPSALTPNQLLEKSELQALLMEGLKKLPPPERLVLSLYYQDELNMREIAPIMNLHLTRISQLKSQGILRLRTYLAKRWPMGRGNTI